MNLEKDLGEIVEKANNLGSTSLAQQKKSLQHCMGAYAS